MSPPDKVVFQDMIDSVPNPEGKQQPVLVGEILDGQTGQKQETFVEVGSYQLCKHNQRAEGDVFLSQKNPKDGRVITTLSDGLGSGIKAGVLATLTATMATKFIANDMSIRRAAEIIMNTLPVCKDRGISYATFTLVDIEPDATVRIMEYDNPPYVLVRQETVIEPIKDITPIQRKDASTAPKREALLHYSRYQARPGDRLIFFSDGVTQSGMGSPLLSLWLGQRQRAGLYPEGNPRQPAGERTGAGPYGGAGGQPSRRLPTQGRYHLWRHLFS